MASFASIAKQLHERKRKAYPHMPKWGNLPESYRHSLIRDEQARAMWRNKTARPNGNKLDTDSLLTIETAVLLADKLIKEQQPCFQDLKNLGDMVLFLEIAATDMPLADPKPLAELASRGWDTVLSMLERKEKTGVIRYGGCDIGVIQEAIEYYRALLHELSVSQIMQINYEVEERYRVSEYKAVLERMRTQQRKGTL